MKFCLINEFIANNRIIESYSLIPKISNKMWTENLYSAAELLTRCIYKEFDDKN